MNQNLTLSKSDYQIFLKAPLHLWARKHDQIQKALSEFDIHIINQGYETEGYARKYLEKHVINSNEGESVQFQKTFTDKQFTAERTLWSINQKLILMICMK